MKKSFKAVMAFLTAVTMTMGAMSVTVYAEETNTTAAETAARTLTGTFKDGASYTYVISSGALIIDGEGSFTTEEFNALTKSLEPAAVIFGRDVVMPKNKKAANEWICSILKMSSDFTVMTFKDSNFAKKRAEMINELTAEAIKAGNKVDTNVFNYAFYLYEVDERIENCEEAIEYFDYTDALVEKGKTMVKQLAEKGIREPIAKEFVFFYLRSLTTRIENFWAYPDGREMDEGQEKSRFDECYCAARSEQDVCDKTADDDLTFNNAVSDFFLNNDVSKSDVYNITSLYSIGCKECFAFELSTAPTRNDDLQQAYDQVYEMPYIAPDLTDIDMVLEYRGNWMRDYLTRRDADTAVIEEIVKNYLVGLKLRIEEGLAKKTGEEINDATMYEFMRLCDQSVFDAHQSADLYKERYEKTRKLLLSDYTQDTADSESKYINWEGDYVKYHIYTENEGVLADGAEYHYNPFTGGIYFDGEGKLNADDLTNLYKSFSIKFMIIGKDVIIGKGFRELTYGEDTLNMWMFSSCRCNQKENFLYTFEGSDTKRIYDANIDYFIKYSDADSISYSDKEFQKHCTDREYLENYYPINIIDDDTDPYEILNDINSIVRKDVKDNAKDLNGDANSDGKINVRDCAYIANCLSRGRGEVLPECSDYNGDGKINVRDAAAISNALAQNKIP